MENEVLTAFSVLKEASELIGQEFRIIVDCHPGGNEEAILLITGAVMVIDASCDYTIDVEYEISSVPLGRVFSSGTRDYESIKRMIHDRE